MNNCDSRSSKDTGESLQNTVSTLSSDCPQDSGGGTCVCQRVCSLCVSKLCKCVAASRVFAFTAETRDRLCGFLVTAAIIFSTCSKPWIYWITWYRKKPQKPNLGASAVCVEPSGSAQPVWIDSKSILMLMRHIKPNIRGESIKDGGQDFSSKDLLSPSCGYKTVLQWSHRYMYMSLLVKKQKAKCCLQMTHHESILQVVVFGKIILLKTSAPIATRDMCNLGRNKSLCVLVCSTCHLICDSKDQILFQE